MHGREGEIDRTRAFRRHMWSVPSRGSTTAAVAVDSGSSSAATSFVKDGRKINVGDCALFKPPHESPPFIGIIHELTSDSKESDLKLGVSWLYRPSEVELSKGVALGAAPNEVFYSFHRDETPAASLLHPCKVAFLPKGVELPSGVSSFVCRRVYDITNRRLWWLTDKDFRNDHQEEINKLLKKSRLEMNTTVQQQQGAHSPKPVNGATATSPVKHSPDSMQNSSSTYPLQSKGKKRELSDQTSEPVKRERLLKAEDGDSSLSRSDSMLKTEIVKTAAKGGLLDSEVVERVVQLMTSEKSQRKMDLSSRSMLAGIIASTDRSECLNQFVQSKGLPVLDEWLQEVHKGKVGDPTSPKESDKSVEEFLLVLLRALDKLPVNLDALQVCNIGKSVNYLRSHKNLEIQKKARSLVETWKKRVEAEINGHEPKLSPNQTVPWPSRSQHDASHGGSRQNGGSSDLALRGSPHLTPTKKPVQGDIISKSSSVVSGVQKSSSSPPAGNYKEGQTKICFHGSGGSEPQGSIKEEKSSSSTQSLANSQCSSDHARNVVPSKEEARSLIAGSKSVIKTTGSSRHRKAANGGQGATPSVQKEPLNSKNSMLIKVSASEKLSQSAAAGDNPHSVPGAEGNGHKIFVKIPNRGRSSPGQSANAELVEDPTSRNSRASSPAFSDKHDQAADANSRDNNAIQSNTVNDSSHVVELNGKLNRSGDDTSTKVSLVSSTAKDAKSKMSMDSSLNALIESCVEYSEAKVSPVPDRDDSGMNLLASVATGEISGSRVASPAASPLRGAATAANPSADHEGTRQSNDSALSGRSSGMLNDDLHKNEESSMKSNGRLDESAGHVSLSSSSTCNPGNSASGVENIRTDSSLVKVENPDTASDAKQLIVGSQPGHNGGRIEAASGEEPTCHSSEADKKNSNPDQELKLKVIMDQVPSLPVKSEVNKIEGQEGDAPGGDENMVHDVPVKVEAGNASERDFCGRVSDDENPRVNQKNDIASSPKNNSESCGSEQKIVCKGEMAEKVAIMNHSGGFSERDSSSSEVVGSPLGSKNSSIAAARGGVIDEHANAVADVSSSPATKVIDAETKLEFDLNEGLNMDDVKAGEPMDGTDIQFLSSVSSVNTPPSAVSSAFLGLPASVTVAAAAKRAFLPPEDLLRNKVELGWKGSAVTSAFRPAEPRKANEMATSSNRVSDSNDSKPARSVLNFDLNVTDEILLEDTGCQNSSKDVSSKPDKKCGGLELDLNMVDDVLEPIQHPSSNIQRIEVPLLPAEPLPSRDALGSKASAKRDFAFDLNDGPAADEPTMDSSLTCNPNARANIIAQPPAFGLRMNNPTLGSLSSWYSPGTTYSAVTTPAALPDNSSRGDHHQHFPVISAGTGPPHRMLGAPVTASPFNPEFYRGPVLTSSPAVPFATTSYQYPVFPFGASFSLPMSSLPGGPTTYMDPSSGGRFCGPAIPTQFVGTAAPASSQYMRPCIVTVPEISGNGIVDSSRNWSRQGLDLNCGPGGGADVEGRDEAMLMASRQLPSGGSQARLLGDQTRAFHLAGGGALKRKEPEGGWDLDRRNYKQPSWQ